MSDSIVQTQIRLAGERLDAGDIVAGWRAARRAVLHAPRLPAARIVLGRALFARGLDDRGVEALTEAAKLAGEDAETWFRIGEACFGLGRGEAAAVALRRAHANDPLHEGAALAVAQLLRSDGDEAEAEAALWALLTARPACHEARLELAGWLIQEGRTEAALALLDAVPAPPRHVGLWTVRRAQAALRQGEEAAARALLEGLGGPPARAVLPYHHVRLRLADATTAPAVAEAMEAALDLPGEEADFRISAHFHLGRFWLRREVPDRAFALWTRGHRLVAAQQPFSRPAFDAFVVATERCFDRPRMGEGAVAADADPAPVFVVGMPRSGTTLTEQILASHAEVHGGGERRSLAIAFHTLGGAATEAGCAASVGRAGQAALDAAAAAYLGELHALAPGAARIVDKMPGNFQYLGLAALLMPGARFIHCVRDPRDIGYSIFSMRFRGNHPYSHDLGDLGWYIARHYRLMAHWQTVLPGRILRVHLFDWIRHFEPTLRRVLTFLDLPYDENCTRFFEVDRQVRTASKYQVRVPVNADGMSRWRPYAAQLAPLIEMLQAENVLTSKP